MDRNNRVIWVLRIATFLIFFGHGYIAFIGNTKWLVYLQTVGFSLETSKEIMPIVGVLDILVAIIVLVKPVKPVVLWAFLWAFATALIRPLSGESIWAFVERGGNWGAPLALFLLLYAKDSLVFNKETNQTLK